MIKDRVFETSTTSGTGSYTLLGAITGARSFQDAFGAGPVKVYYFAVPANADGSFECGIGTFTGPTTLERTSIIASSNSNAAVDWGTEVKNVFCAPPGDLLDRLNDPVNCGTAGGTRNAITLSPSVPVAEYSTNAIYIFTASATNSGSTDANVSGLGNKLVLINSAPLTGGEIVSGRTYGLRYDGTNFQLIPLEQRREIPVARSSNTPLVPSDYGRAIIATNTFTQTFSTASTLGKGWWVDYRNDGTGTITLDPSGSQQIDGAATLALQPGQSCRILCDGTALKTIGLGLPAPPGAVSAFAMSAAPPGWLKANGAAVARASYAALDAAIYVGDGDNATALFGYRCTDPMNPSTSRDVAGDYIVLPDLRGEFVRGWDNGRGVDSGRDFGTDQGDAIRNITATIAANGTDFGRRTGAFTHQSGLSGAGGIPYNASQQGQLTFDASQVVPTANENRPRNVALLYCIKY